MKYEFSKKALMSTPDTVGADRKKSSIYNVKMYAWWFLSFCFVGEASFRQLATFFLALILTCIKKIYIKKKKEKKAKPFYPHPIIGKMEMDDQVNTYI